MVRQAHHERWNQTFPNSCVRPSAMPFTFGSCRRVSVAAATKSSARFNYRKRERPLDHVSQAHVVERIERVRARVIVRISKKCGVGHHHGWKTFVPEALVVGEIEARDRDQGVD